MTADSSDLSALLAHARHELRTPVNALIGYSEMLLEDANPDEQADLCTGLTRVRALGKQLQDLIGELLGAARLESDPHLDLNALEGQVRSRLLAPCQETRTIAADLLQLATQNSLDDFHADLQRIATAADRLLGMLDDPFARHGTPEVAPGCGTVSRPCQPSLTEGLQDSGDLRSEQWHGQEAVPQPGGDAEAVEDVEEAFAGMSGHVLVVDDNAFNRDMLARGLHRQKRYFALASNGRQALEMLETGAFDLVLLDILMPEMDGFETLARIKADAKVSHTPVIMISALDQIDSVVRCIEMGAEDYLPKPFNPVLLKARVGACLEKKRLRDQELEYLRNVAAVTEAAAAVESGEFDPESLTGVARRDDALGRLARVFQSMAREVRAREQRLRQQVQELRIEIDQTRKASQVAEITETDYFQQLQQKAQTLRRRPRPANE